MGLLDGGAAAILNGVFASIYLDGFLIKALEGGYEDEGGSWVEPADPVPPIPIKVQTDGVTEAMRVADGYTDDDVRLIVLTGGLSGPITTDDKIIDGRGDTWSVSMPSLDACGSHWEIRGQKA